MTLKRMEITTQARMSLANVGVEDALGGQQDKGAGAR